MKTKSIRKSSRSRFTLMLVETFLCCLLAIGQLKTTLEFMYFCDPSLFWFVFWFVCLGLLGTATLDEVSIPSELLGSLI